MVFTEGPELRAVEPDRVEARMQESQGSEAVAQIRVVIADDEELARQRLGRLLATHADVVLTGEASDGAGAVEQARALRPHVVFLDIRMPGLDGLEAARQLLELEPTPLVVFLTAHEEHAVQAFELRAFDYLVKPVEDERLAKTLDRIRDSMRDEDRWHRVVTTAVREALGAQPPPVLDRIALRDVDNDAREVVAVTDIDWFRAQDDKTFAHLRGREWQVAMNLARLEVSLPADFFRCHRAYIVNVARIARVTPWFNGAFTLILNDRHEVPLSRGQAAAFREKVAWL